MAGLLPIFKYLGFAVLLVFIMYFIFLIIRAIIDHYKATKCKKCKKEVSSRDQVISLQSTFIQMGKTQLAHDIDKKQGYVCNRCNNIYCKGCLDVYVVNVTDGVKCPSCGGSFGYLLKSHDKSSFDTKSKTKKAKLERKSKVKEFRKAEELKQKSEAEELKRKGKVENAKHTCVAEYCTKCQQDHCSCVACK